MFCFGFWIGLIYWKLWKINFEFYYSGDIFLFKKFKKNYLKLDSINEFVILNDLVCRFWIRIVFFGYYGIGKDNEVII